MKLERYKPNRKGIRQLLGSDMVRLDLLRRGEAVAEVARSEYEADPPHEGQVEVVVDSRSSDAHSPRARVAVIAKHPAVLHIEADRRTLGAALDAAGD